MKLRFLGRRGWVKWFALTCLHENLSEIPTSLKYFLYSFRAHFEIRLLFIAGKSPLLNSNTRKEPNAHALCAWAVCAYLYCRVVVTLPACKPLWFHAFFICFQRKQRLLGLPKGRHARLLKMDETRSFFKRKLWL